MLQRWVCVVLGFRRVGLVGPLQEHRGADSRGLNGAECDWKPLEGVNWCSGSLCRPPSVEGEGKGAAWGGA